MGQQCQGQWCAPSTLFSMAQVCQRRLVHKACSAGAHVRGYPRRSVPEWQRSHALWFPPSDCKIWEGREWSVSIQVRLTFQAPCLSVQLDEENSTPFISRIPLQKWVFLLDTFRLVPSRFVQFGVCFCLVPSVNDKQFPLQNISQQKKKKLLTIPMNTPLRTWNWVKLQIGSKSQRLDIHTTTFIPHFKNSADSTTTHFIINSDLK